MCRGGESNTRLLALQARALPLSYRGMLIPLVAQELYKFLYGYSRIYSYFLYLLLKILKRVRIFRNVSE